MIKLDDLLVVRRLLHRLVVSVPDEPRETKSDALVCFDFANRCLVGWAERQVSRLDLPDVLWCDPDVHVLVFVLQIGRCLVDHEVLEKVVDILESLIREACADFADRL